MMNGRSRMQVPPRFAALAAFVRARFAGGLLGLHLTAGVALMAVAVFVFGSIAADVVEKSGIAVLDLRLSIWFEAHLTPAATFLLLAITTLNSVLGVVLLAGLFGALLYRQEAWHWLLALVIAVPGGMLLNVLLKQVFQRARPTFDDPLVMLSTYSFPSGHTSGATLFYGVLAAYLICSARSGLLRVLSGLLALVMIALVGLSRIYLGAHYLSDVLAAVAVGCAWLALTLTIVAPWHARPFYRWAGRTP